MGIHHLDPCVRTRYEVFGPAGVACALLADHHSVFVDPDRTFLQTAARSSVTFLVAELLSLRYEHEERGHEVNDPVFTLALVPYVDRTLRVVYDSDGDYAYSMERLPGGAFERVKGATDLPSIDRVRVTMRDGAIRSFEDVAGLVVCENGERDGEPTLRGTRTMLCDVIAAIDEGADVHAMCDDTPRIAIDRLIESIRAGDPGLRLPASPEVHEPHRGHSATPLL